MYEGQLNETGWGELGMEFRRLNHELVVMYAVVGNMGC